MTAGRSKPVPFALGFEPGQRLDKYELQGLQNEEGCYGSVYRAYDAFLNRTVWVRVVDLVGAPESPERQRMLEEVQILCRLRHRALTSVLDAGAIGENRAYLVTEQVSGHSLRQALSRQRSLGVSDTIELGIELSEALAEAHAAGLLHGDLRPETIRQQPDRTVKVMNLGIARWYRESTLLTDRELLRAAVSYTAPESLRGAPLTERSDVFALGTLLFELLLGRTALLLEEREMSLGELVERQLETPEVSLLRLLPDIPPALDTIIGRLSAKDPSRRFQTMAEARRALLACRSLYPADASPPHAFALDTSPEPPAFAIATVPELGPPSFVATDLITQIDEAPRFPVESKGSLAPAPPLASSDALLTRTSHNLSVLPQEPQRTPKAPPEPLVDTVEWHS